MDSDDSKKNFFKHVFNFDEDAKSNILNLLQYTLIAIIPIVILNKSMQKFVPEAEEEKGNLEIFAEIIVQIIVMFMGLLLIHRIITYIPTYSGVNYPEFDVIFVVLAILMITLSLQTKLGEKVNILVERVYELWNGTSSKDNKKKGSVKVSQPISQQGNGSRMITSVAPQYNDGTSLSNLPMNMPTQKQQLPNYNTMHRQDNTPLVGASTPGQIDGFMNEPMAANDALGGFGGFSSW